MENVKKSLKKHGKSLKKQLTGRISYNIITQCDEVRKLLSQSPGKGVFISGFGHFRDYSFALTTRKYLHSRISAVIQTIVDK